MFGLGLGIGIGGPAAADRTAKNIFGAALALDLDSRFVTQSGGFVSAMQDQSGNGKNGTAIGAAQPGYVASGVNGIPKMTFNGAQLITGASSPVASGASRTTYAVAVPGAPAVSALFCNRSAAPVADFLATQPGSGGFVYADGTFNETVTTNPTSGIHLYVWKYTVGSLITYLIDGAAQVVSGTVTSSDTGTDGYFAFGDQANETWRGDGYRIIQVLGITTSQQDAAFRTYTQGLYGTP